MISTPQEIEQNAIAIANWIAYNDRPFVIQTSDGGKLALCLVPVEVYEQMKAVSASVPPVPSGDPAEAD